MLTARGQKALRDFWLERSRTALVVVAISLGVAAFTAVLQAYAVLTRELNRGYLASNPPSAVLKTDRIDDVFLRAVTTDRRIGAWELRRAVPGRLRAGPAEWRNLILFVVPDNGGSRIGKLQREQGAWPPGQGEMLIERDAFSVARARIGDTVTVRTARGGEHALHVAGSVHDVGKAQARMENIVYGYITPATLAAIGEEPYFDELDIVVAENRLDENHIRRVVADVEKSAEAAGHPIRRADIPTPGQHPHAAIMGLLLLSMSTFGLFALILSGILIINLLSALMASQVRQIGMMKAVGGTRGQIARIYFAQTLLIGAAAVLLALPLGFAGGRILCRAMAVFLNFDISSFVAPPWVYLVAVATGLGFPFLASIYPIARGSTVTVADALGDHGISPGSFGARWIDRAVADVRRLPRPALFALRNGLRRRTRTALTIVTLAVGGLFFLSGLNVRASLIRTLDRLFEARKFDLSISFAQMYPWEEIEKASRQTPGVRAAEGWITTEAAIPADGGASPRRRVEHRDGDLDYHESDISGSQRFTVVALPEDTRMLTLDIAEGRGFERGDTDALVVNTALAAREPRLKVGGTVLLSTGPQETPWRVVGVAREPLSPPVAYVTRSRFDQHEHAGMVNSVRLTLDRNDSESIRSVRALLEKNLENEKIAVLGSATKLESRYGYDQHMLMIYILLVVTSCLIGGVGGLGLATTMSVNALERRREMGILRAIGAAPAEITSILIVESVAIGIASWAIAVVIAWPLSRAVGNFLLQRMLQSRPDFRFEPAGPLIWLVISVVLGVAASVLPAWSVSRRPVRDSLAYE